jgi:uncharacterized membrane protein
MDPTRLLVLSAHLIGIVLWVGTMIAVYWLQRVHSHSPKDVRDQLTLMERSLALTMDMAAAVAIGCGVYLALSPINLFTAGGGWLHAKLTVVVLGILPVHGMIRARVKKFSKGELPKVPQWQWTLLLISVAAVIILVIRRPF